jgi:hypothetical protein
MPIVGCLKCNCDEFQITALLLCFALFVLIACDRGREAQSMPTTPGTYTRCACQSECQSRGETFRWDRTTRDDQAEAGWCYCGVTP